MLRPETAIGKNPSNPKNNPRFQDKLERINRHYHQTELVGQFRDILRLARLAEETVKRRRAKLKISSGSRSSQRPRMVVGDGRSSLPRLPLTSSPTVAAFLSASSSANCSRFSASLKPRQLGSALCLSLCRPFADPLPAP